jgi:bifunctional glutamyl/prolyl-tRNA synthetase
LKAEFKSITETDWKPGVQIQIKSPSLPKETTSSGNVSDGLLSKFSEEGDKVKHLKSEKGAKTVVGSESKPVAEEDYAQGSQPTIGSIASEELPGEQLSSKIIEQGNKVRKLKSEKASKESVDAEVRTLLSLKAEFKRVTGTEWRPLPSKQEPLVAMTNQNGSPEESDIAALTLKITDQGNIVRQLKSSGADKVSRLLIFFTQLWYIMYSSK